MHHAHGNSTGSVCIGCGCTDTCACDGGCYWLHVQGGVGVCSSCSHALKAWRDGGRLAMHIPRPPKGSQDLRVTLAGVALQQHPCPEGTPQPALAEGMYFAVNDDAGTVYVVNQDGEAVTGPAGGRLELQFQPAARAVGKTRAAAGARP